MLERHDASATPRAITGDDDTRLRIKHAIGNRGRGESAEDHAVRCADARTRKHRDGQLRHHAHVQRDHITAFDAEGFQRVGEARNIFKQLAIRDVSHFGLAPRLTGALGFAFPNHGDFVAVTIEHVTIDRVVTDVGGRADEPFRIGAIPLEHL